MAEKQSRSVDSPVEADPRKAATVASIADDHERRTRQRDTAARRRAEAEHRALQTSKAPAAMSGAHSDPHNRVVGKAEISPGEFAGLGGSPSPRQRAARGETLGDEAPDTKANPLVPFSAGD